MNLLPRTAATSCRQLYTQLSSTTAVLQLPHSSPCLWSHPNAKRSFTTSALREQKLKPRDTENSSSQQQVMERGEKPFGELTTGEKVARAGKDATYTTVIIAGVGITGVMFYMIGRELLSGDSPSGVYGRGLKLCRKHEELVCAIGEPMKGYGEMTRRGRRRHVSHMEFEREGVKHMRMQFYVEGPDGKGTAHLEVKQNERGKYDFHYLYVQLDNSYRKFVIVDNR